MPKREANTKSEADFKPKVFKSEENGSDSESENEKTSEKLEYNMPKPGPHAKAGEWRKWKMMKRAIRQEREEQKMLKQNQKESEVKLSSSTQLNENSNKNGRNYSLSIAVPGSILSKIQSKELRTSLIGQIARAATLFYVDEIIVYNEFTAENKVNKEINEQFLKVLEYLECPQYLRKALFPPNKYLENVGILPPIEAPHHLKFNDNWTYREGVTTDIPSKTNKGSWVDIGLMNKIEIDKKLDSGIRVTVKKINDSSKKLQGIAVSPETPRIESDLYWGYQIRYADSFKKILFESCFGEEYNVRIAINLNSKLNFDCLSEINKKSQKQILIVYGGVSGIETAMEADEKLKANKIEDVFDYVCEGNMVEYGSRSMRLEEAILISLSRISSFLK